MTSAHVAAGPPLRIAFALMMAGWGGASWAAKPAVAQVKVSDVSLAATIIAAGGVLPVSYTLSQAASSSGVTIEFMQGTNVLRSITTLPPAPGTQAGANTVPVYTGGLAQGSYTVRVTALDGRLTDFAEIADRYQTGLWFNSPNGVDVNRVAGHPAFGRIYVSEGDGGSTPNRSTVKGVYVLNPDLTDPFPGAEPKARTAGAMGGAWTSSSSSPNKVTVGPDGNVYISDWSNAHSGLFEMDPDGAQVDSVFAYPYPAGGQRESSGLVRNSAGQPIYGGTTGVWVEGTGAGRKIFVGTEDMLDQFWRQGNVMEYDIPAGSPPWASPPVVAVANNNPTGNYELFTDTYIDVVRDTSGNFYVTNYDSNQAFKFSPTGAYLARLPATTGQGYYGIAIDEPRDLIALASSNGKVFLTNRAFAEIHRTIYAGSGYNMDVAFDADGWLYVVNYTIERLMVFAPPGTPVTGTSASASQTLSVAGNVPAALPGDIAPVGPNGLYVGPHGRRYGDGKLDMLDSIYSLRVAAGLADIP